MAKISNQELHAVSQALAILSKVQNGKSQQQPRRKKRAAPIAKARNKRRTTATRSMGEIVLAQGVGRVPRTPFGGRTNYRGNLLCWDAFNEAHAPLPRSIGPYAVVRTTKIFTTSDKYLIFGTAMDDYGQWTSTVCWSKNSSMPMNGTDGVYTWAGLPPGAESGDDSTLSCVPSAMSVQILNPSAIDSANGVIYAAVCPTQLNCVDNSRTWDQFGTQFTSFMKPRLMSGGKLALRGVQMNSFPLNMAALSSFEKINNYGDGHKTWAAGTGTDGNAQYLTGFAPMVVVNTSASNLTYCVTTEYRVRFDISNPAVASHKHHGVTPDWTWDSMIKKAISLGNGVKDIVETVSTYGQAANGLRAIMP